MGKQQDQSLEPARIAHIDYTMKGLRDSARYCRSDIKAAAQNALDAEDVKAKDVPRYAAYSVWVGLVVRSNLSGTLFNDRHLPTNMPFPSLAEQHARIIPLLTHGDHRS